MKILFCSSAVAQIQNPRTGGVQMDVINSWKAINLLGHEVTILAPRGSKINGNARLIELDGRLQILMQQTERDIYPIVTDSFLANQWQWAYQHQSDFDIIINFAHDWLPFYLTGFFKTKILHRINVGNISEVVSDIIRKTSEKFPGQVGYISDAQLQDIGLDGRKCFKISSAVDIDLLPFYPANNKNKNLNKIAFIARIAPEKGLENACKIAQAAGLQIALFGYIENADYFAEIKKQYAQVIDYRGYLVHQDLFPALHDCRFMLCTHNWMEALGLSTLEALACGIPVITHDIGGPAEVIKSSSCGFIITPGNIIQAVKMIEKINEIDARNCRKFIADYFSISSLALRYERWFDSF